MTEARAPSASHASAHAGRQTLVIISLWLLTFVTFSSPNRVAGATIGSLDLIATAKVASRGVVILGLSVILMTLSKHPKFVMVMRRMLPFYAYFGWAVVTVLWSPLKAFSLGQAASLLTQLMLATAVGILASDMNGRERILRHLCLSLLAVAVVILGVDAVAHEASGLARDTHDIDVGESIGIVHPTSAGATASLGITILVSLTAIWPWRWPRLLALPAIPVHAYLMFLAASRTSVIMAFTILVIITTAVVERRLLGYFLMLAALTATFYLAVDPDLEMAEDATEAVAMYLARGADAEQLARVSGRAELWEAIAEEVAAAPVLGHGYFVTSRKGVLDVWDGPSNRTAHNILLQVLVSTGLIGTALFLAAMFQPVPGMVRALTRSGEDHRLATFLILLIVWYLGWGQFCESFMGPVQPETVVFYSLFGLSVGAFPTADQVDALAVRKDRAA